MVQKIKPDDRTVPSKSHPVGTGRGGLLWRVSFWGRGTSHRKADKPKTRAIHNIVGHGKGIRTEEKELEIFSVKKEIMVKSLFPEPT